ncbi:MAG: TonB-dependent receptor [Bryobacteraceae bacterium]
MLTALVVPIAAQQGRGTVLGVVSDASGGAVPGAAIAVRNTATGVVTHAVSNETGYFTTPPLVVGPYEVTAEKQGFKKFTRTDLTLRVDQQIDLRIQLEVGSISESVEVTGEAPLLDTNSATVGTVVETRRLRDLPVNGRSAMAMLVLTPGVNTTNGDGGSNSGFADRGNTLASVGVNGGVPTQNNYQVDGNQANNNYYPDLNVNPTVDAVEEFKVQSGSMSAEYGFTSGAVINVVTKGGTNDLHGTTYEFIRNPAFDAANTFTHTVSPYHYNQYGGAAGGPIRLPKVYNGRDRSFFFVNFEEWKYPRSANPIYSVPTANWRNGNFSDYLNSSGKLITLYDPLTTAVNPNGSGYVRDLFPNNVIPSSRIATVANNVLDFYPLPNKTPSNAYTQTLNYMGAVDGERNMRQVLTRVDHRFSESNSFFGRYIYYRHYDNHGSEYSLPDPVARMRYDTFENHNVVLNDVHTFTPTLLHEIRVGLARQQFPFTVASYGGNWPEKLGLGSSWPQYTLPYFSTGYSNFNTGTVGYRGATTGEIYDTITKIAGRHNIKFGTQIRIMQGNNLQMSYPSGSLSFSGLTTNPQSTSGTGSAFAQFLLGAVSSASFSTHIGASQVGNAFDFFVQDDWKVSNRLTVNLGLRYDYQQWPWERNNGLSNFDPFSTDSVTGLLGRTTYSGVDYEGRGINSNLNNWGPRIGFAWDLTGKGKTVLRAGYGIYNSSMFSWYYFGSTNGFASTSTSYTPAGANSNFAAFYLQDGLPYQPTQSLGAALGPSAFIGQSVSWEESKKRSPMAQQWNLSLQHEMKGWVVDATYSANRGSRLLSDGYDYNAFDPKYYAQYGTALQDAVPNPYAGKFSGSLASSTITRAQSLKPYPYYSSIGVYCPTLGNSIYHAFYLTAQTHTNKGLTLLMSYSASKLIDDSMLSPIGTSSSPNWRLGKFNRRIDRSLNQSDVPQALVVSGVYELPIGRGKAINVSSRWLDMIVGGWQMNAIFTAKSGMPLVVTGASNNRADRPNSTGKSAKLENPTRAAWFDTTAFVNPPSYELGNISRTLPDVRSPGLMTLDASAIKQTKLAERLTAQLRVEGFNVTNRVNLGSPGTGFSPGKDGYNASSTFGLISSARDARMLQLGLKLIF